jgi:serine/threonine-protein kinase
MAPENDGGNQGELIGRQLGDYLLEGLLGSGGMAEVYRARELALGREVAVKVLPASLAHDRGYVERFRAEAQRVAALQHPHIVPVYYYSEHDPLLYLVMPILKESLRDRIERERRLDPAEAIRICQEIASALEAAHSQGLVHRDVKPENILLDASGAALLTDFGIARDVSLARQGGAQTLSGTGLPVGTPEYMAPEQLRNENVDARADIYALGAVLYELVAGRTPHEADTPYEVAALVLMTPISRPSRYNRAIWPALDEAVMMALASKPGDRFATAAGFAAALTRAGELAGTSETLTGIASARIYATRRFTRPFELPETPEEIEEAPTIPVIAVVRPAAPLRLLASLRRQRVMLAASLVALLLVALLGSGTLAVLGAFTTTTTGGQTVFLPGSTVVVTATLNPTAAALATAIAQGTPGAVATATAYATQMPQPTATVTPTPIPGATATSAPTATNTPTPTPTPTPQPTVTPLPGAPLTMTAIALFKVGSSTCEGTQTINNTSSFWTVGWRWVSVPSNFHWSLYPDTSIGHSGIPNDSSLAPEASDTVYVKVPCGTYTVTVVDSFGNTYPSISMHYP